MNTLLLSQMRKQVNLSIDAYSVLDEFIIFYKELEGVKLSRGSVIERMGKDVKRYYDERKR